MIESPNDIGEVESAITLADCVRMYMTERQIFNEKYYVSFLRYASNAWEEIFHDTLYVYNARWCQVKSIGGRHIIDIPKDCRGFISASIEDRCGNLKRIPYDAGVNVIEKPNPAPYDCMTAISSFITTTKYIFSNAGVDYYETTNLKYCFNGDVIENIKTPVKNYQEGTGDTGGDYNPDYNDDYSHPSFSNFTIDYKISQRVLCNLDTTEDGTPKNIEANVEKLKQYCGSYSHHMQNMVSAPVLETLNIGELGSITLSENRKQLIYTLPKHKLSHHIHEIPDYILLYFRGSALGNEITGAAIIPDDWYIRNAMACGIDSYSMRFNRTYTANEKMSSRALFDNAINGIIKSKLLMNVDIMKRVTEIKIRL